MADFTMTLSEILKNNPNESFGLDSYPIFDETYRAVLNQKIIDEYLNMEIGQETVSMFRHAMRRHMNKRMPYWNQMYESERLEIDPLLTMRMKTVSEMMSENTGQSETASNQTSDNESKARTVAMDTPQRELAYDGDYASSANDSTSQTSVGTQGNATANESSDSKAQTESQTEGFNGNQSDMLMAYRRTFINIDEQIIDEIAGAGLFMGLWSSGDEYFRREGYYHGYYPLFWRGLRF